MALAARQLGLHDIEFESDEFNRAFQVKCPDPKFANDVIDSRMMQWLLTARERWAFELSESYLLCYAKRMKPLELTPLFGGLKGFVEHIPRVAWSLYGTGAPATLPPATEEKGFLPRSSCTSCSGYSSWRPWRWSCRGTAS